MKKAAKWALTPINKIKLTIALALITGLLIMAKMYENRQVEHIDASFLSIYKDRLVPATTIFNIREQLYRKDLFLQATLQRQQPGAADSIQSCNQEVGKMITDYKTTFFLEQEKVYLTEFENKLDQYNQLESRILSMTATGNNAVADSIYQADNRQRFNTTVNKLSQLNSIQSEIGKEMMTSTHRDVSGFLLLSQLEVVLIFLLGMLAMILIRAGKNIIPQRIEPFNLN